MATLNFSRLATDGIKVEVDSVLSGTITVTRSDSAAVDFSGKTILLDIMKKYGETPVVTLTSGTEITISTNALTISKTFTELTRRAYDYELYNSTDNISIAKGKFIAI